MGLSTHILDTALGRPAQGVSIQLTQLQGEHWRPIGEGLTDLDGRCKSLLGDHLLEVGTYRLRFVTAPYFTAQKLVALYPYVDIVFDITDTSQHYHIPLLLTANGYTTYRGS